MGKLLFFAIIMYLFPRGVKMILSLVFQKTNHPSFDDKLSSAPNLHWLLGHSSALLGKDGIMGLKTIMVDAVDKHGVSTFWLPDRPAVYFLNPKDAQRVLRQNMTRPNFNILFKKHFNNFLGPDSILITNRNKWKTSHMVFHKALTLEALHDAQACMNELTGFFSSTITRIMDGRIRKKISKDDGYLGLSPNGDGVVLDYSTIFKMITVDVIGNAAFGYNFGCSKTLTSSYYALAFDCLQLELLSQVKKDILNPLTFFNSFPTPQYFKQNRSARLLREFLILFFAKGELSILKKKRLKSQIYWITFLMQAMPINLVAGYETSLITLSYAAYLLATNPDVNRLCAEEARTALGERSTPIPKDLDPNENLVYCQAVIYLRLFPHLVFNQWSLEKPMNLDSGVTLPSGTPVFLPTFWIQRVENNFPNSEICAPERWATQSSAKEKWVERLEEDHENDTEDPTKNQLPPAKRDAFLSFSAGGRMCVGRRFAIQEATIVLAACVRELQFEVVDGYVPEHQRNGATFSPANGMLLITKKRE